MTEQEQPSSEEVNTHQPDTLREHAFDGIQEYDNDVPHWMSGLFVLCCLWGAAYLAYYWLGPGKNGPERYLAERTARLEAQVAAGGGLPPEELLRKYSHDADRIAKGEAIFMGVGTCTTCHGANGVGLIGPHLRDDFWRHGSDMTDMYNIIYDGNAEYGMQAFRGALSQDDIINVSAFIAN
jgi:cytochrome c oxidase cbb3-type subunit 3